MQDGSNGAHVVDARAVSLKRADGRVTGQVDVEIEKANRQQVRAENILLRASWRRDGDSNP
jgi:hypothetical protein